VTDRPTDHASRSVTIGRTYIRSTGMRPNNNDWYWVTGIALSLRKSKRTCLLQCISVAIQHYLGAFASNFDSPSVM